jgi:hypothetical protein
MFGFNVFILNLQNVISNNTEVKKIPRNRIYQVCGVFYDCGFFQLISNEFYDAINFLNVLKQIDKILIYSYLFLLNPHNHANNRNTKIQLQARR